MMIMAVNHIKVHVQQAQEFRGSAGKRHRIKKFRLALRIRGGKDVLGPRVQGVNRYAFNNGHSDLHDDLAITHRHNKFYPLVNKFKIIRNIIAGEVLEKRNDRDPLITRRDQGLQPFIGHVTLSAHFNDRLEFHGGRCRAQTLTPYKNFLIRPHPGFRMSGGVDISGP